MKRLIPALLAACMLAVAGYTGYSLAQSSSSSSSSSASSTASSSNSSSTSSSSSSSVPYAIISWNAPTVDANGNPLPSPPTYQVYWSTVAGQAVTAYAAESPPGVQCCTYTAGPLVPGTQYWWYVTATNSIGTSVPSSVTSQLVPGSASSSSSSTAGPAVPAAPTAVQSQIVYHTN